MSAQAGFSVEESSHDLLIVGSGLSGLRAGLSALSSDKSLDIAVISKEELARPASVCAEGGMAGAVQPGDSPLSHFHDTVKGSDYLADQDAAMLFVERAPRELMRLEHWGMPWARQHDGRVDARPYGGHTNSRALYVADSTGIMAVDVLFSKLFSQGKLKGYPDCFVVSLLLSGDRVAGLVAIDHSKGVLRVRRAQAAVIATGGAGRMFATTTNPLSSTGDGIALALRAGLELRDMEFVQFHPTTLVPGGHLISEACRGEGGILLNSWGERFMVRYAPGSWELAPRDVVSRAIITEFKEGRGLKTETGTQYIHLDITHLGQFVIDQRLRLVRQLAMKFAKIDPVKDPMPVRPGAHYLMGGVHVALDGSTALKGLWVAGEAGCTGVHGANRLGCNSTSECLVWGAMVGENAARFAAETQFAKTEQDQIEAQLRRLSSTFGEHTDITSFTVRARLARLMDETMGPFRTGSELQRAVEGIRALVHDMAKARVSDHSLVFNTQLQHHLETENLLLLSLASAKAALWREESRGAHFREDFPERNDKHFLAHSLARWTGSDFEIRPLDVRITSVQPRARKY